MTTRKLTSRNCVIVIWFIRSWLSTFDTICDNLNPQATTAIFSVYGSVPGTCVNHYEYRLIAKNGGPNASLEGYNSRNYSQRSAIGSAQYLLGGGAVVATRLPRPAFPAIRTNSSGNL